MVATGRTGWKNPSYNPRNKVEAALQKKFDIKGLGTQNVTVDKKGTITVNNPVTKRKTTIPTGKGATKDKGVKGSFAGRTKAARGRHIGLALAKINEDARPKRGEKVNMKELDRRFNVRERRIKSLAAKSPQNSRAIRKYDKRTDFDRRKGPEGKRMRSAAEKIVSGKQGLRAKRAAFESLKKMSGANPTAYKRAYDKIRSSRKLKNAEKQVILASGF